VSHSKDRAMKAIKAAFREKMKDDGYYDGRFATKNVPNKRRDFLEDCYEDLDKYQKDIRECQIKPSPHRR